MFRKTILAALALALPLSLGAVASATAQTRYYYDYYGDRYDRSFYDYYDRGGYYDRNYYDRRSSYYGGYRFLRPEQIRYRLVRYGYSRVRDISYSRRYRAYRAEARDWRGYRVRLLVSAYTGRIIDSDFIGRRSRDRYYGY
jgi:hypothetical protein